MYEQMYDTHTYIYIYIYIGPCLSLSLSLSFPGPTGVALRTAPELSHAVVCIVSFEGVPTTTFWPRSRLRGAGEVS